MFNPNKNILALDFDGVIADSIAECLVVGRNAYTRYLGKTDFIASLSDLNPDVFNEGRRLRNFIRAGQDYVYIHMAINQGLDLADQSDYDAFTEKHADKFEDFFRLFYAERQRLLDAQPEVWYSLNPLYRGIQEFLLNYPAKENVYIVTTKKVEYVIEILQSNQINLIESHMFHANSEFPKADVIQHISKKTDTSTHDIIFIDDQVDTLIKVKPTEAICYLAVWGYNNETQQQKSLDHDIAHLNLTDLVNLSF